MVKAIQTWQQNYDQHFHEFLITYSVSHWNQPYTIFFYFAEKLCPDNCTSQSQGTCDTTNGNCNCNNNFVGASCAIQVTSDAECKSDLDCPENKFCSPNGGFPTPTKCENPCANSYVCGYGAECEVKDRKAICTCNSSEWTGNPDPYVVSVIPKVHN